MGNSIWKKTDVKGVVKIKLSDFISIIFLANSMSLCRYDKLKEKLMGSPIIRISRSGYLASNWDKTACQNKPITVYDCVNNEYGLEKNLISDPETIYVFITESMKSTIVYHST